MGAVLEPRPAMTPWYSVEVRRESAYVTATTYLHAHYAQRAGEAEMTDADRAGAWLPVDERTTRAPGTPAALAAAMEQIADHPVYREWRKDGSHAGDAGAELRDGLLLVTAPNSYRYGPKDADEIATVEVSYEDVGPILADLQRLRGS